jgi:uncharacterized protein (TIGR02466 family)
MIHNLFPTPIGHYKLEHQLTSEEFIFLNSQQSRFNAGNYTSVNNFVLTEEKLLTLKLSIESKLEEYFNGVYKPKNNTKLKITQSWINYTEKGQFHHRHNHPNSFISGVFYIQASKEKDRLYFYRGGYRSIEVASTEWNMWNSDSWWFEVGAGDLILFPSELLHMVQTVEHDETRISLAFNAFPVGFLGDAVGLTLLEIKG